MAQSVYIHIPFCSRICPYCDFNKYVVKGQSVEDYLHGLQQEMERTALQHRPEQIKTLFIGGGTPTTLTPKQMDFLLESVYQSFPTVSEGGEFTVEANPESMTEELLAVMKAGGVNRLSIGVQTFEPSLLKKLGRMHTPQEVYTGVELAQKIGFSNISLDLMFGLPGQSLSMFEESLEQFRALELQHLSAYSLKVEEGTFFHTLYRKDKLPLPTEEEEVQMYDFLMESMAKQGFSQYEISNFALPGYESKHNLTYWRNEEYYGVGAGAHGYLRGIRHVNAGPLKEYLHLIEEGGLPQIETHSVTPREAMEDMMIMGLRTSEGVSKNTFFEKYHISLEEIYGKELETLLQAGLLQIEGERFSLTKKGKFLGNEVFATFLREDHV